MKGKQKRLGEKNQGTTQEQVETNTEKECNSHELEKKKNLVLSKLKFPLKKTTKSLSVSFI
jgi:hypothetical protein